jgi:hypothetical protein
MMQRVRSQLHLQLGQEVIYVLMTLGLIAALVMLASGFGIREPAPPLPDCASPGRGPCISQVELPKCMQPGLGPCLKTHEIPPLPDCASPGRGPCISQVDLPKCMQPGLGPCLKTQEIPPLPNCALPGRGPCISQVDLPKCMQPGLGPCLSPDDRPPILNLTEREGFRFAAGSYEINDQFMAKLRTVIAPQIRKLGDEYNARVVEVVGHTDSVPVRSTTSSAATPTTMPVQSTTSWLPWTRVPVQNSTSSTDRSPTSSLDRNLIAYLSSDKTADKTAVEVIDNVALGMMRAASVVRALRQLPEFQGELQGGGMFVFLAMSAGRTIAPGDRPIVLESGPPAGDQSRRRVQIRLRRSLAEP